MATRIIGISDTHYVSVLENLVIPIGTILCHMGDYSMYGDPEETLEFFHWLKSVANKFKAVFFLNGNHDFLLESDPESFNELLTILPENVKNLHNSGAEIDGIKFYGFPHVPALPNWAFTKERGEKMKKCTDTIPECDVLLSHGPPYEILDEAYRPGWTDYGVYNYEHVGCQELNDRVFKINPKLHLFGHIHEAHGKKKIADTTFINCSTLDRNYKIKNLPVEIEI
jgi:Icc-related predicted phosphoesterase